MDNRLLFPELELTKENLLAHFKEVAINGEITVQQVIANALDQWRGCYHIELSKSDLVELISKLNRQGVRAYCDQTVSELLDAIWDELIETCGHTQIDTLIAEYDFLS